MSSSDALPFVLVHGAWLWKAGLAALVGSFALAWFAVWRLRPRIRPELPWLAESAEEVRGVLVGPIDAPVQSLQVDTSTNRHPDGTYDLRPAELHLQTDDGRKLELRGDLRVLAGSRAAVGRAGVPRRLPRAQLAELQKTAPWLHYWRISLSDVRTATLRTLAPGDRVIARGVVERGPATGETDFRSAEVAWSLRGAGDEGQRGPVELVAEKPAAERLRPSLLAVAILLGGVAVVGYPAERRVIEAWEDECSEVRSRQLSERRQEDAAVAAEPFAFSNGDACVRATMSPRIRDYAVERLANLLEDHPRRSDEILRRLNAVDRFRGECKRAVARLDELNRYEEARAEAVRCGDAVGEYRALMGMARFEEASRIALSDDEGPVWMRRPVALIAAGKWDEAARAAADKAAEIRNEPREDAKPDAVELTVMHYQCLAALLRHYGGDAEAVGELRELRGKPYGVSCAPMLADAEGPSAQNLAIDNREPHLIDTSIALDRMTLAAGLRDPDLREPPGMPEELLVTLDAGYIYAAWEMWLMVSIKDAQALPPLQYAYVQRWKAAHQVLLGDVAGAKQTADEVIARQRASVPNAFDPDRDPTCLRDGCSVQHLPSAIAMFTSATDLDLKMLDGDSEDAKQWRELWMFRFGRLMIRAGKAFGGARLGPDGELEPKLAAAQQGDGRALAKHMTGGRYRLTWWSDADLIAVLPRVKEGRDEIREQLRWSAPRASGYLASIPTAAVRALARRTVMELAGLPEQAKMWDEIAKRYDQVLSDHQKLMALMFYQL